MCTLLNKKWTSGGGGGNTPPCPHMVVVIVLLVKAVVVTFLTYEFFVGRYITEQSLFLVFIAVVV